MIARARTAKTSQKVNDMLSTVTGNTSMDAFERMKEKVEMLESKAEVSHTTGQNVVMLFDGAAEYLICVCALVRLLASSRGLTSSRRTADSSCLRVAARWMMS